LIALGPFRLDQPIGRGGMGQVWAGAHLGSDEPVAVKFLTSRAFKKPGFLQAFRNEVRLVAALDHPNVVQVFDAGEASAETARVTHGRIAEGTPWLAMELVKGGTLAPLGGKLTWTEFDTVVWSLLEALGHAHARGVIHRDLKPGNVLVVRTVEDGLTVKLTDFGLASQVEQPDAEGGPFAGGTPAYMAPEQFETRWRDYGPWTDLYGAGCLLWSLATGLPPFGPTTDVEEKRRQHLTEAPPELKPAFPVPAGFEAWLRTFLHKDPARRFRRAADALHAFRALGPPDPNAPTSLPPTPPTAQGETLLFEDKTQIDETTRPVELPSGPGAALPLTAASAQAPPVPSDWRRGESERRHGPPVGLGLFGLRAPTLVDRLPERDALWRALRAVDRTGLAHAVVLAGPEGCGKSRLAEWVCQRAHETGAAHVLKASHAPIPGPTHGLGPMLKAALRCQGLDRPAVRDRVEQIFRARGVVRPDEAEALTEVIAPAEPGVRGGVRFVSPTERYVTVRRLLHAMTQERAVVLWLDDAHHSVDAVRFALYLLDYPVRTALPLLLVLTTDEDGRSARRDAAHLLSELSDHDRAVRVPVGPLPAEHRPALVQGLLGLEPGLARRVEARTEGNPLFVVQLVGDWVQRGALEPGPEGFALRTGVELPHTVREMWAQRVARMLEQRTAEEGHALELAAVLGVEVEAAEWGAACLMAPRALPSDTLLGALLDQGLARTGPEGPAAGWSFAHRTLREALIHRAEEGGRLPIWHRACAELLESRGLVGLAAERVGRHWLGALQPGRAAPALLTGARDRLAAGDYAVAEELVTAYEGALGAVGVPLDDPRWGEPALLRWELAERTGAWERSDAVLDEVTARAEANGWAHVLGRARALRARRLRVLGRSVEAVPMLAQAEADAARRGDRAALATLRLEMGNALLQSGDVKGAERWARLALREFESHGDAEGTGHAWVLLGSCAKELGDHRQAMSLLHEASVRFEELGLRWKLADALNTQGDVARAGGDAERAVALYRRARGLFKAIGSKAWVFPEYNTGLVHLERGDHARARPVLETAMAAFLEQGNRPALANAHLAMAIVSAHEERWILWDHHLTEGRELLAETRFADEETAQLAAAAGEAALRLEQPARARDAQALARTLWVALGRTSEAEALERRLAQVP
jgi:serine/threonine protein kinase/tetratricopeptide (TPR) repeat protein